MLTDTTAMEKRAAVGKLFKESLECDQLIRILFPHGMSKKKCEKSIFPKIEPTLEQGLHKRAEIRHKSWHQDDDEGRAFLLLGLRRIDDDVKSDSVIIGPIGGPESTEAETFVKLWGGKELCKLRRFEDGSIRESVEIENEWGQAYIEAAIIKHLLKIHFNKFNLEVVLNHIDREVLPMDLLSRDNVKTVRSVFSELSSFLTHMSDPSLPIRRVRGLGPALHSLGDKAGCYVNLPNKKQKDDGKSKVVFVKGNCSFLKKDATVATSKLRAVPVLLDVTHKKNMDQKMFKYLTTAFLINLKKKLEEKDIPCLVRNLKLYALFKGIAFCISVEDQEGDPIATIDALFQALCLRHSAWAATAYIVKQWITSKMLDASIPEHVINLLLSHVFSHTEKYEPKSAERGLLHFFDLLAFFDFAHEPIIVDQHNDVSEDEKAKLKQSMMSKETRQTLPEVVIQTPFDKSPSMFTKGISPLDFRRLINLGKQGLAILMSGKVGPDWSKMGLLLRNNLDIYDVLIQMKPLQLPKTHSSAKASSDNVRNNPFPVIDFDPVECFLHELKESYGHFAHFYYGQGQNVIGVKLDRETIDQLPTDSLKHCKGRYVSKQELIPNVDAMIEDFKVIGAGLVKEVVCNVKV